MRRAFTLLELLVALAIVGIVAALLLPALGRARGAAKRATCINNLHQINAAVIMYADDHADSLRSATNDYHVYFTYRENINNYLSRNGSGTNDAVFACPADNFDCTKSLKNVVAFVDGHVGYIPIYWNGNSGIDNIPIHYNPPAGYEYGWFDK